MPDHIENEARVLAQKLDTGRQSTEVADALRNDSYNMSPRDFNRLVQSMMFRDEKNRGDNLSQDRDGNLVIDQGNGRGFYVATRDYDMQQQAAANQRGRHDGRHDGRGGRGNNGRDAVEDGVVNGVIGAVVGGAIDGKKGAIAGGAAGVGNVIIDRTGGTGSGDDAVRDGAIKAGVGAGIGAIITGDRKGAVSGAAGSAAGTVLDRIFNRRQD